MHTFRKLFFCCIVAAVMGVTACNKKKHPAPSEVTYALTDSTTGQTVRVTPPMHTDTIVEREGKKYLISIERKADTAAQPIRLDDGECYAENSISVRVTSGEKEVFSHTFTKGEFRQAVDSAFYRQTLLEGMAFLQATPEGLVCGTALSHPQSDLHIPFNVVIKPSAGYRIEKVESLEEE